MSGLTSGMVLGFRGLGIYLGYRGYGLRGLRGFRGYEFKVYGFISGLGVMG